MDNEPNEVRTGDGDDKPKSDVPKKESEKRSYYYDDAHGYEDYVDDEEDEADESPASRGIS